MVDFLSWGLGKFRVFCWLGFEFVGGDSPIDDREGDRMRFLVNFFFSLQIFFKFFIIFFIAILFWAFDWSRVLGNGFRFPSFF